MLALIAVGVGRRRVCLAARWSGGAAPFAFIRHDGPAHLQSVARVEQSVREDVASPVPEGHQNRAQSDKLRLAPRLGDA